MVASKKNKVMLSTMAFIDCHLRFAEEVINEF